jgi:hypothetical protein
MSPELVAAIGGILIALQGATLAYVVRIERRLTRLETIDELSRELAHRTG